MRRNENAEGVQGKEMGSGEGCFVVFTFSPGLTSNETWLRTRSSPGR